MARTAAKKPAKAKKPILGPLPSCTVLLALDASSSAIGWAVFRNGAFRAAGVARSPMSWDSRRRIEENTAQICEVVCEYDINHVVIEWQDHRRASGNPNAQGLAVLGQSQGFILGNLQATFRTLTIDTAPVRESTKIGNRNVRKDQRAEVVKLACPDYADAMSKDPKADKGMDVSDAIGLGLWRLGLLGGVVLPTKAKRKKKET